MRLGTCLLYEGHSIQGARTKMAYFCSAPMEGFYAAVDTLVPNRASIETKPCAIFDKEIEAVAA